MLKFLGKTIYCKKSLPFEEFKPFFKEKNMYTTLNYLICCLSLSWFDKRTAEAWFKFIKGTTFQGKLDYTRYIWFHFHHHQEARQISAKVHLVRSKDKCFGMSADEKTTLLDSWGDMLKFLGKAIYCTLTVTTLSI